MGFVSYLEDITERLTESFSDIQYLTDELEQAKPEDLGLLRSELAKLKSETQGLLKVLNDQVLEMLSDPNFEVFGEWQTSLTENERLKADKGVLVGELDKVAKEAEQMKAHLRLWKGQLSQAERVAMDGLLEADTKNKELQELQQLFLRLQTEIRMTNSHVVGLTQENAKLKKELDEANAMAMEKIFKKTKPQRK